MITTNNDLKHHYQDGNFVFLYKNITEINSVIYAWEYSDEEEKVIPWPNSHTFQVKQIVSSDTRPITFLLDVSGSVYCWGNRNSYWRGILLFFIYLFIYYIIIHYL